MPTEDYQDLSQHTTAMETSKVKSCIKMAEKMVYQNFTIRMENW